VGVRSRVGTGVVDDGDTVVDDNLPAEAHADGDVAGGAGGLVGADLLACVFRGPVAGHNEALRSDSWTEAFVAHGTGDEVSVVGNGRFDKIGSVPRGSKHRRDKDGISVGLGEAAFEPVLGGEGRVLHAEGAEHVVLCEPIEPQPRLVLCKPGDVEVTLAGIAALGTGLELEGEGVIGHSAPIGEAGLVGETESRGEELVPGIVLDVGIDPKRIDRLFYLELALGGHTQDGFSEDGSTIEPRGRKLHSSLSS